MEGKWIDDVVEANRHRVGEQVNQHVDRVQRVLQLRHRRRHEIRQICNTIRYTSCYSNGSDGLHRRLCAGRPIVYATWRECAQQSDTCFIESAPLNYIQGCSKGKGKRSIAVRKKPHRYGNSRAIWDHTVLPATRQR